MKLRIVTTQKDIESEVTWIELNTPVGNMMIQHGHAPMIIELASGHEMMYQKSDGVQHSIMIVQGIAHVNRDTVTVFLPIDL